MNPNRSVPQIDELRAMIMRKLRADLSPDLHYHCPEHTEDVVASAVRIGRAEGVSEEGILLLETGALLHDIGFLFGMQEHEAASVDYAREILPVYGYTPRQIDQICDMIAATEIPQSPDNKLSEILCDADLDYLGREDFYRISQKLLLEFKVRKITHNEEDFNRLQVRFFESHHYFTETNRNDREPSKQAHLQKLKDLVASYAD